MRSTFRTLKAALLAGCASLGFADQAHAEEATEEAKSSWLDNFTVGAFADAYVALRSDNNNFRTAALSGGGDNPIFGDYPDQGYVNASGFGLAFAGMDVNYAGDKFGATMSLRYGPGVVRFFGNQSDYGIANVTQAYVTWKPFEALTLDLGQFGTLYGAEVAESWRNLNYSRGSLYYLMQPFWHTGLRANYAITDKIAVNAMLVNGVNTLFENNKSPSVGAQLVFTPIDPLFLAVGYLGALNPNNDGEKASLFDNFFDVFATLSLGDFNLVANFDFNQYKTGGAPSENWWGISVAPGYAFTNWFGAAARVEYLSDSANALFGMYTDKARTVSAKDGSMVTLTGTLDFKPIPNSGALVLRPEFRYDIASDYYFFDRDDKSSDKFWTVMLGAVVTSM